MLQEIPFCSGPPEILIGQDAANREVDSAAAYVAIEKIWSRQKLNVHFLNDEFPDKHGWKCGSDALTVAIIMAWAKVWNSPGFDKIPLLKKDELNTKNRRADIRVMFTSKLCTHNLA